MIHISATGLQDLLKCEKNFYYRIYKPETSVSTAEAVFGKIIHKAIQNFSDRAEALDWAVARVGEISEKSFTGKSFDFDEKTRTIITNYYDVIIPKYLIGNGALVEHKFFIPFQKKLQLLEQ